MASGAGRTRRLRAKIWTMVFAIFAFEIGIFLAVFPWMEAWRLNHFPVLVPSLIELWEDPYLRGAVTGLGLINLWISLSQILSLFKKTTDPGQV